MTKKTRLLLFISLIIIFLLAAPTMLFYAMGYSFDWQKKKPVITGGIYLKSFPKKAKIYLNEHPKNYTPRLLKRLVPGEYQIKITKDGYYSWQKKMEVKSKLVAEARNIFLFPQNQKIELVDSSLPKDFSLQSLFEKEEFEKEEKEIFYIQKPSYILYKINEERTAQTQLSRESLPENPAYQIIVSPNQNIAVLNEEGRLYFLNSEKKTFEPLADNIKEAQFSDDNKKLLYFSQDEIWVYYLEDILVQPFKTTGQKELITRINQEIKQAVWYPETNEHIIFAVGEFIKITELDGRDIRNTVDFLTAEASQIIYDKKTKKMYFVEDEKLYGISLEKT